MWLFWMLSLLVLVFGFVVFFGAPYVPSKRKELKQAFEALYKPGKKDLVVDIGSGDGVVLRMAATYGARAVGYELNPLLVLISKLLSRGDTRVSAHVANFWLTKIPEETTLVYVFAVSRDIKRIAGKIQKEVNRTGRPLKLMTYGSGIPDKVPLDTLGAHNLYDFAPLQETKA
jgi:hypothetical protein